MSTNTVKHYIGIKHIKAEPLTQNKWLVENGKPVDPTVDDINGYRVTYPDNYVSWCPATVFEESYKVSGSLSYPMALFALLTMQSTGVAIQRVSREPTEEVIVLISGAAQAYGINKFYGDPNLSSDKIAPAADGFYSFNLRTSLLSQWFPTTDDQLANDWKIVEFKSVHPATSI